MKELLPGYAAEKNGAISVGDVLVEVDGVSINRLVAFPSLASFSIPVCQNRDVSLWLKQLRILSRPRFVFLTSLMIINILCPRLALSDSTATPSLRAEPR